MALYKFCIVLYCIVLFERHLARRAGEPGGFYEAAADYFRDVGLHRQLTVKMDPEITNGLQGRITVVPVSSVRSESVSFASIWRQPNHIGSVLAALSSSLKRL